MENKKSYNTVAAVIVAGAMLISQPSLAQTVSLSSGGSSADVVLSGAGAGMNSWYVDTAPSANQLNKQWFYYRIGNGLAQPINTIGGLTYTTVGTDTLEAIYSNSQFSLTISYVLSGGGTGTGNADIQETISVLNTSGSALDFHLFQYSDFNLLGSPGGDSVVIGGSGGFYNSVLQWDGMTGISESITTPPADRAEAALAFTTLANLNSIPGYDLNNNTGPLSGDVTWSFQWDRIIPNNESLDVFKDKQMSIAPVPEPSVLALIGAGLIALGLRRKHN